MKYYKVYFSFYGSIAFYGTTSKKLLKHYIGELEKSFCDYYLIVEKL